MRTPIAIALPLAVLAVVTTAAYAAEPPNSTAHEPISLAALETRLTAQATSLADRSARVSRGWLTGASAFASSTLASVDEVVDVGRQRSYDQTAVTAGVRVPLAGSRAAFVRAQRDQAWEHEAAAAALTVSDRQLVSELRRRYVALWSAGVRQDLAEQYLRFAPTLERVLQTRTTAGLLLESDRQDFMTTVSLTTAERGRAAADAEVARGMLDALVGLRPDRVVRPSIEAACGGRPRGLSDAAAIVAAHPTLVALEVRAAPDDTALSMPWWSTLEADLRLGVTHSYEPNSGESGRSAFVGVSFDYRFNARATERDRVHVRQAIAASELRAARARLESDARRLLAHETSLRSTVQHTQRVVAATESKLRERSLRAAHLPGDRIEQQAQARYALYRARVAEHQALRELLEWRIAVEEIDFRDCVTPHVTPQETAALVPRSPVAKAARGLYVWQSARFIAALAGDRGAELERLTNWRIERVMLSLDRAQIERYSRDDTALRTALQALAQHDIRVELLLGEPTWMLATHRGDLLGVIASLSALPFDGLHLDLEPNQLAADGGDGREHLTALAETLTQVATIAPWPVALSVHPRYLTMPVDGIEFGSHLVALGVTPSLMIYVADVERIAAIATPLLTRWPALSARVAVSLETELDAAHSFAHQSPHEQRRTLDLLNARLSSANYGGLDLQPEPDVMLPLAAAGESP
jgi:outer membrane protein TolC